MPLLAPLAAPPVKVAPPTPVRLFRKASMTWTGWDGSVWDITSSRSGAFVTDGGLKGLHMPPFDRWTATSPMLPGSRYTGSKATERECFWPLFLYSDDSTREWYERDRAFWATMRPDEVGTWTVTTPDGSSRTLKCRFVEVDDTFTRDPGALGWSLYGITLVAEQPFWTGPLETRSFTVDPPVAFFGAEHATPDANLLFVSSGSTLASASIDNLGDEDTPPVVVLSGPWDAGASVGVGADVTVYNAPILDGKSVVIDARPGLRGIDEIDTPEADAGTPEWWAAVNAHPDGTDVLTNVDPNNIALDVTVPRGDSIPLAVEAAGAGAVHVALEPQYHRAW